MVTRALQLVAVGDVPLALLKDLEPLLLQSLGVAAATHKVALTEPKYAFNKDRNQFHSNAIMRRLVPLLESKERCALGVCEVDLFVPDLPFVFGEADRESRIGLVSLFRLRQGADPQTSRRRFQVEAVHQAGHLFGLSYCEDPRCVMFLASTSADVDRKAASLCNLCRNELNKLSR